MAARIKTVTYTFTDTASKSLKTILNISNQHDDFISDLVARAARLNVGDIYWGDSSESWGGYLGAHESAGFDLAGKYVNIKDVYFKAQTANDVLYITLLG